MEKSPLVNKCNEKKGLYNLFIKEMQALEAINKILQANQDGKEILKIVLLGEVKAGKSTLLNAMLGKEISYINFLEATATVLEVNFCEKEKIVIEKVDGSIIDFNTIVELNKFLDENRTDQILFESIKLIYIGLPLEDLKNITLVDTPGLCTLTYENASRTESYISQADIILWILNANHLGQSDIMETISEVLDYGKPVIGILNRIDEVDGSCEKLVQYVESEMEDMFKEIFAVSSKLALEGKLERNDEKINRSNINKLQEYIEANLIGKLDKVQDQVTRQTINVQNEKIKSIHHNVIERICKLVEKYEQDLRDVEQCYNHMNEISERLFNKWFIELFLKEEKKAISEGMNIQKMEMIIEKITTDIYIKEVMNKGMQEISREILQEWQKLTNKILEEKDLAFNFKHKDPNTYTNINNNKDSVEEKIIDGVTKGGLTAGGIGLSLAGYSALLGPAAASITLGSALVAIVPPLLIAGAVGGGIYSLLNKEKSKESIRSQAFEVINRIKENIRESYEVNILKSLSQVNDMYKEQIIQKLSSILTSFDTNIKELQQLQQSIEHYISTL